MESTVYIFSKSKLTLIFVIESGYKEFAVAENDSEFEFEGPDGDALLVGFDVPGEFDKYAVPKVIKKDKFTLETPESLPLLIN